MKAGKENGRRGYQLTYSIAYIRDFLMQYYIIAESFETSAAWSDVLPLIENVKKRLLAEYSARKLPAKPFVTARVTQVYQTGAAIYFYLGFYYKGVPNPSQVYCELENIAREEILRSRGSLSHHHGVGKIRQAFLPAIMSPTALEWKRELKRGLDPENIFGAGNQ
jgi:alkyldihydroxyacetonephosphate synthase